MNRFDRQDKVLILGSCFAASVGSRLLEDGYDVCLNPFGTIFNPASIASSLERLASGRPFTEDECVQMGSGSDLWCSFSHYTRFARPTKEEFLENANAALASASAFFHSCSRIILTFGTAYVFRYIGDPGTARVVSNCLKRPAREFSRELMSVEEIVDLYRPMLERGGILAGKEILMTVSPIRHMADGAHGNQISKATLLLAQNGLMGENVSYFPAYEIVLDELRDYCWYAEDKSHPNEKAVSIIWDRFKSEYLK